MPETRVGAGLMVATGDGRYGYPVTSIAVWVGGEVVVGVTTPGKTVGVGRARVAVGHKTGGLGDGGGEQADKNANIRNTIILQ